MTMNIERLIFFMEIISDVNNNCYICLLKKNEHIINQKFQIYEKIFLFNYGSVCFCSCKCPIHR